MSDVTRTGDVTSPSGVTLSASAAAGGGAPTGATYIVQTAHADLSAEQALSSLATGLVAVTTGTGVLSTGGNVGSTDNAIVRTDGTGGEKVQGGTGAPMYDDSGNMGVGNTSPQARHHVTQSSLGTAVEILESTATNDDVKETTYHNRVTTTDATVTTVHTFAIPASTTVCLEVKVVARRTGGVAGTAEDGASYHIEGTYKNVAGTATIIGTTETVSTDESQAAWGCVFTASGGNVLLQVAGADDNNVVWHAQLRVMMVST